MPEREPQRPQQMSARWSSFGVRVKERVQTDWDEVTKTTLKKVKWVYFWAPKN